MSYQVRHGFWREAVAVGGAVARPVLPRVLLFGLAAAGVCGAAWAVERAAGVTLSLDVTPHELAGTALGLLLVLRTNAGYDRWWEARKLWGGFVDRGRNVAIGAVAYGPADPAWRQRFGRWLAAYPHVVRATLRGQPPPARVVALVGPDDAARLAAADHMPSFVARQLADLLREATDRLGMDRFAFLQVDRERALLIDHFGGCERILGTPLPRAYSIQVRHLIALFLLTLPLALLHRLGGDWLVPLLTMMIAYPLLTLDQLGVELENPFPTANLSHLPIDDIAATIERNVLAILAVGPAAGRADPE